MKWFKRILWSLLLLLVLVGGVVFFLWQRGQAQMDGERTLSGLRHSVSITRDAADVTHIVAEDALDAWRALGFVHAQERAWQLEFNRRLMHGELSELLGPSTLELDQLMRTLGIMRSAKQQYERLSPQTKAALEAYSQGIVAAHAQGAAGRSAEFLILRTQAGGGTQAAWTPVDSVGWALMMALDLSGNWGYEHARLVLSRQLNHEQLWTMMPPYAGDAPATQRDLPALYRSLGVYRSDTNVSNLHPLKTDEPLAQDPPALHWAQAWARDVGVSEGKGSNNWVVPGSRTKSGKPLVANDPHLGLSAPAIWYFARLQAKAAAGLPALDVMGATLPGMPFVVLGRTRGVAWGFTNTAPDVQDLYLEALRPNLDSQPADAGQYKTPTGWEAFETREEIIRVKNQPDVRQVVRATRHGPVISDVQASFKNLIDTNRYAMALRWAALDIDNSSMEAARMSNFAQSVPELIKAYAAHHSPMQSVVMADVKGEVAFQAIGRAPIRSSDNDINGVAPAPGWLAAYDWVGWIPYAENPAASQTQIEQRGWHATANQKITPPDYRHWLTADWVTPDRMNRITQLLDATSKHDVGSTQAIQTDVLSLGAKNLLPYALQAQPRHELGATAMNLLKNFDAQMTRESAAAALFNVWSEELTRLVFEPAVGVKTFASLYGKRNFRAGLLAVLQKPNAFWCPLADCTPLMTKAMDKAIERMVDWQGSNPNAWHWGMLHQAISAHRPFAKVSPLDQWFNVSVPSAGDLFSVNVGLYWANESQAPFANRHAASLRAIYDLSDESNNLFIYQTGQSGHAGSSRSKDMAQQWANGQYRALSFDSPKWVNTLVLKPQ